MSDKHIPETCGGHCGACDEKHRDWESKLEAAEAALAEAKRSIVTLEAEVKGLTAERDYTNDRLRDSQQQVTQQAATIATLKGLLGDTENERSRAAHRSGQQAATISTLSTALNQLANEASGFKSMADPFTHGHTNMAVLGLRIDEARAALASIPAQVKP